MVLSLDNLASRYGCLPSHVLGTGSTFDLTVIDIAAKYEDRKQRIQEDPEKVKAEERTEKLGQTDLQAMIDAAKE